MKERGVAPVVRGERHFIEKIRADNEMAGLPAHIDINLIARRSARAKTHALAARLHREHDQRGVEAEVGVGLFARKTFARRDVRGRNGALKRSEKILDSKVAR